MKELVRNAVLLVVSIGITLLVVEIGVRLFYQEEVVVRRVDGTLKADRTSFTPHFEAAYKTSEYEYSFRTNRFGRRDVEWDPAEIANPDNILFIGDSFVYGFGMKEGFTLPDMLEDLFQSELNITREVFNYGMPGPVSFSEYLQLLEKALDAGIKADSVVVATFLGNDFMRGAAAVQSKPDGRPKHKADRSLFDSRLVELIKSRIKNSTSLSSLALKVGGMLNIKVYISPAAYIFLQEQTREQATYFQSMLTKIGDIRDLALENGRDFSLIIIPNKVQVENKDELSSSVYDAEKPNRQIMDYCVEQKIACLDLLPVLREAYLTEGTPQYFPIDRHFTVYGNELAARAIFAFLKTR